MRTHSALVRITLASILVLSWTANCRATNYFVRKTGSDYANGKSAAHAFRTIKKAATVAVAGDTVYVGAGTYTDVAKVANDGTSSSPIRFVADSSGTQTGDAGAVIVDQNKGFYVEYDHYIEIVGFVFEGHSEMVYFKDCVGGVVKDCEFRNGQNSLSIQNARVTVDRCNIHNNLDAGILVDGSTSIVTITNCTVMNSEKNGIEVKDAVQVVITDTAASDNGNHGVRLEANGSLVTVARCTFQRNNSDGFHSHGQHQLALENCLMTDNAGDGLQMHADDPAVTVNHCTIANNGNTGIDWTRGDGTIRNSIVAFNGDRGIRGSGYSRDYNLYYGNVGGNGFTTGGSNDIFADPKFKGIGNYHLQDSSPALDSGTGSLQEDLINKARPNGPGVDRGCYEEGPPVYYVRVGGDDSNSGASPSQAFRTISRAASIVDEGAIVYVGAGTYSEGVVVDATGTSSKPILFVADTGGAKTGDAGSITVTAPLNDQYGWTVQNSAYISLDGFRLSGSANPQANGLSIENSAAVTVKNCEIDSTQHGIRGGSSTLILENLLIHDTTTCGIWLSGISDADVTVQNLTLTDNMQYGLFIDTCDLSFDASNIGDWAISGSPVAMAGVNSSLVLENVTISGGTTAAVHMSQGTLAATNCVLSGSGYGLSVDGSAVTVTNCTFSGNSVGLYADQNQSLHLLNCALINNTQWGAVVVGGATAGTAIFEGCTMDQNAGGLSVAGAVAGQVSFRAGTTVRNNTNAGLYLEDCQLTLADQASEGWVLSNNGYGVYAINSTLVLDGFTSNSNTFGVWLSASDVSITNSLFTGGNYGLWATNNNSLSIDGSTFSGNGSYGAYLVGNGTFHNCSLTANGSGLYVNGTDVTDDTLTGTEISGNIAYGLYIYQASLDLTSQLTEGWSIQGNGYNIAGYQANMTLLGVELTDAATYGVLAQYGSVNLQQSTVTSNLNGVGVFNADSFMVDRCRISGASAGSWAVVNYASGLAMQNTLVSGAASGVYSYGAAKPVTIYNVTIANASQYGLYIYNGTIDVVNTIIAGTNGTCGLYCESIATVTHSHNLVFGFALPFQNTTVAATELLEIPRFVDAANGDFHLAKGSPAINAGADLSASYTLDLSGNARPSHRVFEMGAYEYTQDAGSLRILSWQERR